MRQFLSLRHGRRFGSYRSWQRRAAGDSERLETAAGLLANGTASIVAGDGDGFSSERHGFYSSWRSERRGFYSSWRSERRGFYSSWV